MMVPSPLLGIPPPWASLDSDPRTELEPSAAARQAALEVLDRCLDGAGRLPHIPPETFPEWITIAWGLWSSLFADEFGSFDGFRKETIVEYFAKQDPTLTEELVQRYATAWLRRQALDLAMMAHHWTRDSLRNSPDRHVVRALRDILARRWHVDEVRAESLMNTVSWLDPEGSLPVIREIAESPDAPAELAERARELLPRS
jgi:hypothetical protein